MSCKTIMTKEPPTIASDDTVAVAAARLMEEHHSSLPVVDAAGRLIGMFGIYDLLGLLVPRVALAGDIRSNLRFIEGDPDGLRQRYREVKTMRVCEVTDRNGPSLASDAPEIEAIRLCCRNQTPIPVVERETDKLIGVISCWDAIRTLVAELRPA